MNALPSGWASARLGDLATKVGSGATPRGGEPSYKARGTPLIRSMNVVFFGFKREGLAYLDDAQADALKGVEVQAHDVLLNITGASIGRVTITPVELAGARVNQHVCIIRAGATLDPRFLNAYLSSPTMQSAITAENYGVTRQALTKQQILDFEIPIAPLPEQKRIADKLDALLSRVDACRSRLDRVPGILKRFRQSVLSTATSGELTRDWREEQGHDSDWPTVDLESVATEFSYGSSAKSSKAGKVPVLRMGNIQDGLLDWGDLVFTSDAAEIAKYKLTSGDVLFNRTNSPELVGKTAVFRGERDAIYAGYLIRVRCSERLLPDYLNYCLGSPAGREYCWQVKSDGVSQSNINAKKLAAFTFGLPSIEEQREIVRRVELLLVMNEALSAKNQHASMLVERLTPSMLAKAFRGELVPQDPNDEPASELLAKLKAMQLNATTEPPRTRQKTQGNRPTMSNSDKDTIKAVILQLKNESFSFDDLRALVAGDYESLKGALFELLDEPHPVVRQVFDKRAKTMKLERVRS